MAGTYVPGQSQPLSGVYTIIRAIQEAVIGAELGIVAYPFTADWGPTNQLVTVRSQSEFELLFGKNNPALTSKLIHDLAFAGRPLRVLGYRMATSTAAKGTVTLAEGWTLETAYPSARSLSVTVRPGVGLGTTAVSILENGVRLVEVEDTTVSGLQEKINGTGIVRVTAAGAALPVNASGIAFSGGNSGGTVTNAEYATFLETIEADGSANAFSLDGVTEEATLVLAETWLRRVRSEGFYLDFYRGGPSSWDADLTLANTASIAKNYRAIHNVGNGVDGYTPAQMAIFQAAFEAGRPLSSSVTDQPIPFQNVNVKSQLTRPRREAAKRAGTILYIQVGTEVQVDEGVNTLTKPGEYERIEFGKSRVSRALDYIARSLEQFGNVYKRNLSNTPEARAAYAATIEQEFFAPLARDSVIFPDYSYVEDARYHGENPTMNAKIDEAFFLSGVRPVDSMEKIYQELGVRF